MLEESDEALMGAVREGNVDKLGVLFERHIGRVYALCYRLSRSADAADDLAQETFLRVLRYRGTFGERSAFTTWLYRLALNVCHDYRRASRKAEPAAELVRLAFEPDEPKSATSERDALLEQAMERLPPERRTVLVLTRYHDLTYEEVARVLDCSAAAARVRAHRALNELREIYRELEKRQHELR